MFQEASDPPPIDDTAIDDSHDAPRNTGLPFGMSSERFHELTQEKTITIVKPRDMPGLTAMQQTVLEGLGAEFYAKTREVDLPDIELPDMSDPQIQALFPEVTSVGTFRRIVGETLNYVKDQRAFRDKFGSNHGFASEDVVITRLEDAKTRREHIIFLRSHSPEAYRVWVDELKRTNQMAAHNNMTPVAMSQQILAHMALRGGNHEAHQAILNNGKRIAAMARHEQYDRLNDIGKLAVVREYVDTGAASLRMFMGNRVAYSKHKAT